MEMVGGAGDDAGRCLAARLEGGKPERRHRRRIGMAENAEYPALLVERGAIKLVGDRLRNRLVHLLALAFRKMAEPAGRTIPRCQLACLYLRILAQMVTVCGASSEIGRASCRE